MRTQASEPQNFKCYSQNESARGQTETQPSKKADMLPETCFKALSLDRLKPKTSRTERIQRQDPGDLFPISQLDSQQASLLPSTGLTVIQLQLLGNYFRKLRHFQKEENSQGKEMLSQEWFFWTTGPRWSHEADGSWRKQTPIVLHLVAAPWKVRSEGSFYL